MDLGADPLSELTLPEPPPIVGEVEINTENSPAPHNLSSGGESMSDTSTPTKDLSFSDDLEDTDGHKDNTSDSFQVPCAPTQPPSGQIVAKTAQATGPSVPVGYRPMVLLA